MVSKLIFAYKRYLLDYFSVIHVMLKIVYTGIKSLDLNNMADILQTTNAFP